MIIITIERQKEIRIENWNKTWIKTHPIVFCYVQRIHLLYLRLRTHSFIAYILGHDSQESWTKKPRYVLKYCASTKEFYEWVALFSFCILFNPTIKKKQNNDKWCLFLQFHLKGTDMQNSRNLYACAHMNVFQFHCSTTTLMNDFHHKIGMRHTAQWMKWKWFCIWYQVFTLTTNF